MQYSPFAPLAMAVLILASFAPAAAAQPTVHDEIIVSAQDYNEYAPAVAYNHIRDEFFVAWHDNNGIQSRSIMGRRYTANGALLDEYVLVYEATRDNSKPSIAFDPVNNRYLLTYIHDAFGDGSDYDIYGRLIPWDGPSASFAAFPICTFPTQQWDPEVAFAGTDQSFMVTWWNAPAAGNSYISAQRVPVDGVGVDPSSAIVVASAVTSGDTIERVAPDIAYNQARNEHLIVFQYMDAGGGHVYAVRLTAAGSILGGGEFGVAPWPDPETAPRVAASRVSDEWAVTWQSDTPSAWKDVYARRVWVDYTGIMMMADPVHVAGTSINESYPEIAAYPEDSSFLITWEQQYSSTAGPYGISGRTLDDTNAMGAPFDVRPQYIGEDPECTLPAAAGGKLGWFVTWQHERHPVPNFQDIHAAVVSESFFFDGFESGDPSHWTQVVN